MLPGFHRIEPYANPHLNVFKARRRHLCAYCSRTVRAQLVFDKVDPTFGWRVISVRSRATHGTIHAVCLPRAPERLAGLLAARSSGRSTRRLFGERVIRAWHGSTGTRSSGGSEADPQAACPASSFYAAYHVAAVFKPPTLPTAHDPVLRFEPIIQIVSILSPPLFIQRIGQRGDRHYIVPRYGLSVQRCLRFLDVLFLRVRVCVECSWLHLSQLLLFIPSSARSSPP